MSGGEMRLRRDVLRSAVRLAVVFGGTVACGKATAPIACLDVRDTGLTPDDGMCKVFTPKSA